MIKKTARHIQHYIPLISIFLAGILGFVYFSYDKVFQVIIALAVAVSYVAWGLIHHYIHDDLHFSVVVEYASIAILGLIIIFSLVFRA
jgi:EamA domain-containing membrane protein RarD